MPKLVQKKAKVLIPVYYIEDPGGIVNWAEHLYHGLTALGAEVDIVRIENKPEARGREQHTSSRNLSRTYSGIPHDQRFGWYFPNDRRIPLLSTDWPALTSKYDLVIWAIPVPSPRKIFEGWEKLYDIKTPQIMVIHDGNLNKFYPHAYTVMDKCVAAVGVHDCAFFSIDQTKLRGDTDFRLIPNPQVERFKPINYDARTNSVFSVQTWKRWKRVDDLVRAVPWIIPKVMVAGNGMEYRYMTSKDKRKEEYGDIWEKAIAGGMEYAGLIDEDSRDELLQLCKLLIDPSWSKSYAQHGSHFNRSFVDAIICGCLPAGRDMLMRGNSFFDPQDYVTIPWDATPQEFADIVNNSVLWSSKEFYISRINSLQSVVRTYFDSRTVADQYLEYA